MDPADLLKRASALSDRLAVKLDPAQAKALKDIKQAVTHLEWSMKADDGPAAKLTLGMLERATRVLKPML